MRRRAASRRGFIAGLGIGQICSWGSLYYSFPLLFSAMHDELGWSKSRLYGAVTAGLLLAGLLAYPVGAAIDRGRGRAVMAGASLLAAALLVVWARAHDPWVFYLAAGGIGALQAATLYEPAFAVIAWRNGAAHARRDITELTLWAGFASTVFVPLVQALLSLGGWRATLLALAAVNVGCALLYAWAIDEATHEVTPGPAPKAAPEAARPVPAATDPVGPALRDAGRSTLRAAFGAPVFWAFGIALVAYSAVFSAFTFHLYPLLLERHLPVADVVAAMAVIGPAQVLGRFAIGMFAAGRSVRTLGAAVVVVFPLVLMALAWSPLTLGLAIGVAAVYGAANGIFTIVRGLAVPEMISRTRYGAINGALTAPATLARAMAPMGAAALWAVDASYAPVMTAMIAGSLLLALGFWVAAALPRPASLA